MRSAPALLVVALVAALPGPALGNGAFPDSLSIFAPPDRPHEIVLATNFGLLITTDGGLTWRWVCEQAIASLPFLYQMGPAPTDTLYAVSLDGLVVSGDRCAWSRAAFTGDPVQVTDVFPDPSDPMRVLALGRPSAPTSTTTIDALYESRDGGLTFPRILYQAPPTARLESVEVARSDPRVHYLTMTDARPARRLVLRSTDGGAHFEAIDQTAVFGGRVPLIAAVDPEDASRIYFRVLRDNPDDGDALGLSDDGGTTVTIPFTLSTRMSAFLRRSDRALILGTILAGGSISSNGGRTFAPWRNAPRIRALAERSGTIYAAADNFADMFAAGETRDDGATWKPLVRYDQIKSPLTCGPVAAACDPQWPALVALFGIDDPAARKADAGAPRPDTPVRAPATSGCKCSAAGGEPGFHAGAWVGAVVVIAARFVGRRRLMTITDDADDGRPIMEPG